MPDSRSGSPFAKWEVDVQGNQVPDRAVVDRLTRDPDVAGSQVAEYQAAHFGRAGRRNYGVALVERWREGLVHPEVLAAPCDHLGEPASALDLGADADDVDVRPLEHRPHVRRVGHFEVFRQSATALFDDHFPAGLLRYDRDLETRV